MKKEYPSFTWFGSFTEQVMDMYEDMGAEFAASYVLDIIRYTAGEDVEFEGPKKWAFKGLQVNIDNSIANHMNGKKGGRPRKDKAESTVETGVKNPPSEPKGKERRGMEGMNRDGSFHSSPSDNGEGSLRCDCGDWMVRQHDGSMICFNCHTVVKPQDETEVMVL